MMMVQDATMMTLIRLSLISTDRRRSQHGDIFFCDFFEIKHTVLQFLYSQNMGYAVDYVIQ